MKKLLFPFCVFIFFSCNDAEKKTVDEDSNKIYLRHDTLNTVKLSDTLVIYESTCRGCAYENSTHYEIKDSLQLVKLLTVKSSDNNPPEMDGGSISQKLIIVPLKTGSTTFKMYKTYGFEQAMPDSPTIARMKAAQNFTTYQVEIKN